MQLRNDAGSRRLRRRRAAARATVRTATSSSSTPSTSSTSTSPPTPRRPCSGSTCSATRSPGRRSHRRSSADVTRRPCASTQDMHTLKTPAEIDLMREAGQIVASALVAVRRQATVGMTLKELDELAEQVIRARGAEPLFKDYLPGWATTPFPGTICASVNDVIVHGIPDGQRLEAGDLVSIDCGARLAGWCGDAALSFIVDAADPADERLDRRHRAGSRRGASGRRSRATRWATSPTPSAPRRGQTATPCSPTTAVTASDARCTKRRRCPTPGSVEPGRPRRRLGDRPRADAHRQRRRPLHRRRRRVDGTHGRRIPGRPCRAHGGDHRHRPTHPHVAVAASHRAQRRRTRRAPPADRGRSSSEIRRRPTLPGGLPPSTIGADRLNFRVRDGNGCDPVAMATEISCQGGGRRHLEDSRASTSDSIQALGRLVPVG